VRPLLLLRSKTMRSMVEARASTADQAASAGLAHSHPSTSGGRLRGAFADRQYVAAYAGKIHTQNVDVTCSKVVRNDSIHYFFSQYQYSFLMAMKWKMD